MGAQGGNVVPNLTTGPGGLGAEIGGDFTLTAGEILQIAVVAEAEALLSSAQATEIANAASAESSRSLRDMNRLLKDLVTR